MTIITLSCLCVAQFQMSDIDILSSTSFTIDWVLEELAWNMIPFDVAWTNETWNTQIQYDCTAVILDIQEHNAIRLWNVSVYDEIMDLLFVI